MSHQWDYSLLDFPSFPWQHTWKKNSTFDCKAPFHPGTASAVCLELWHHGWRLVFHCGRTDLAPIFARVGCSWALRFCWFLWKPTGSPAMFVWRTDWLCIPETISRKPVCNLMHLAILVILCHFNTDRLPRRKTSKTMMICKIDL